LLDILDKSFDLIYNKDMGEKCILDVKSIRDEAFSDVIEALRDDERVFTRYGDGKELYQSLLAFAEKLDINKSVYDAYYSFLRAVFDAITTRGYITAQEQNVAFELWVNNNNY
jgi:hypothetical protein